MYNIKDLINICKGHIVWIQTHNFPDADAIASAFGLHEILKQFRVESKIFCAGQIDRLSTEKLVKIIGVPVYSSDQVELNINEQDYNICVDSQKLGGNITNFNCDVVACIDHHPTFKEVDYKFKQVEIVGACATLITEHFISLGLEPDIKCATALLYGIKMDTSHFTRGVTKRDIEAFSFLLDKVDAVELRTLETNNLEANDLKAYGSAVNNIHIYNRVGIVKIPFSCQDALIGSLSDFILSLDCIDVAIVYSKRVNGLKFSIRSLIQKVNAGDLAFNTLSQIGNGGGHAAMAGGFIPSENFYKLGMYPDVYIENLFLSNINRLLV